MRPVAQWTRHSLQEYHAFAISQPQAANGSQRTAKCSSWGISSDTEARTVAEELQHSNAQLFDDNTSVVSHKLSVCCAGRVTWCTKVSGLHHGARNPCTVWMYACFVLCQSDVGPPDIVSVFSAAELFCFHWVIFLVLLLAIVVDVQSTLFTTKE